MKKQVLLSLIALGVFALGSTAQAYLYSDADYFGGLSEVGTPLGVHMVFGTGTGSVTSSFNIVAPDGTSSFTIGFPYVAGVQGLYASNLGFPVGAQTIVPGSVQMRFFFRDPSGGTESVLINVADVMLANGSFSTLVLLNIGGSALIEGSLNALGFVFYTVTATSGEFFFDAAYLQAEATPDGGATVTLLGVGLCALGAVRRKFIGRGKINSNKV